MDLSRVWRHLIAAVFITVGSAVGGEKSDSSSSDCPDNYWDEPSKRCVHSLLVAIEDQSTMAHGNWSSSAYWINKTCTLWQQTNRCYEQLLSQCQTDDRAYKELHSHAARTWVYSLACSKDRARQRQNLIECFQPHIKPMRTCAEAFDKYFRNFVNDKQFRNACRVVSTAMKCFNEVKKQIGEHCKEEGEREFIRYYIQPLADQTRHIVVTKCEMSPIYAEYFNAAPTQLITTRTAPLVSVTPIVALLVARWRFC